MAKRTPRSKPAGTDIDGPINDAVIKGITPAVETIQAFAREIALMSGQAIERATRHVEKLREAQSMKEATAIQADFLKESMEDAVQHTRKYIQMLATFPHGLVRPVNAAVAAAWAARRAAAAKAGRLSEVDHKT